MDSGNSGSFQSSSGEDEFDSQTDGISALLMNNNQTAADHVVAHSNHQQPPLPPPPPETLSSYIYHNPLSNYFDLVSRPLPPPPQPLQNNHPNNNTLLINSDVDWLKTLRSETEITAFQSLLGSQDQVDENTTTTNTAILVSPPPPTTTTAGKNPRKRSRASRRAPTTVLTTDTSNFRSMVQEFTGIPAPPFTSAPTFLRNRFDLFGGGRASHSHLSMPFPQKVQLGSSSIIDQAIASSNSNTINANNCNPNALLTASLNYNYQCPPQTSSSHYFNVPNPIVSSFLDPEFPPSTKSHQESLDISPNDSPHMKMGSRGGLDEYSCHLNTNTQSVRPNLLYSADQTTVRKRINNQDGVISWKNNGSVNSIQDDDHSNFNFST